jgi:hypothetical protein
MFSIGEVVSTTSAFLEVTTGTGTVFMLLVPPLSVVLKIPSGVNEIPSMNKGVVFSPLPTEFILLTLVCAAAFGPVAAIKRKRLAKTSLFIFFWVIIHL